MLPSEEILKERKTPYIAKQNPGNPNWMLVCKLLSNPLDRYQILGEGRRKVEGKHPEHKVREDHKNTTTHGV